MRFNISFKFPNFVVTFYTNLNSKELKVLFLSSLQDLTRRNNYEWVRMPRILKPKIPSFWFLHPNLIIFLCLPSSQPLSHLPLPPLVPFATHALFLLRCRPAHPGYKPARVCQVALRLDTHSFSMVEWGNLTGRMDPKIK